MPTVTIPDDVYAKLEAKASAMNRSVEDYVSPFLEIAVDSTDGGSKAVSPVLSGEAWWKMREEMKRDAESRAAMYPPGYQSECGREWLYAGEDSRGLE
jgi:hypothetical protein